MDFVLVLLAVAFVASAQGFNSDRLQAGGQRSHVGRSGHRVGIYGGRTTNITKYPYLAAVTWDAYGLVNGAGVIVSKEWVVTTVFTANTIDFFSDCICAGCQDGVDGDFYCVEYILLHPKYDFSKPYDYNYALIKIQGEFNWTNLVQPIPLPRSPPKANTVMNVAGWGYSKPDWDTTVLRDGHLTWQSTSQCKKIVAGYGVQWTKRMACAYNKHTTLCDQDGGDPLFYKGVFYAMWMYMKNNGTYCGADSPPLVFMDIHAVAPWIKSVTGAKYEDE